MKLGRELQIELIHVCSGHFSARAQSRAVAEVRHPQHTYIHLHESQIVATTSVSKPCSALFSVLWKHFCCRFVYLQRVF